MSPLRAVIVGCGRIAGLLDASVRGPARSHARAYARAPGIFLAGFADIDARRARALARRNGRAAHGTDAPSLVETLRPDVVSVCTPDPTHYSVTNSLLRIPNAPRAILLEKPACSDMRELRALTRAARRAGTLIVVNHSRRFSTQYRRLRRLIRTGSFGRLVRVDAQYYGGWRHNGVHIVDTLRFLFGRRLAVTRVRGCTAGPSPDDPTLDVALSLPGGAAAHLHGFDEKHYQLFDLDFKFDRSRLRIEDFESRFILERRRANKAGECVLAPAPLPLARGAAPLENAVREIARALRSGDSRGLRECTLDASADTLRVMTEGTRMSHERLRRPHRSL